MGKKPNKKVEVNQLNDAKAVPSWNFHEGEEKKVYTNVKLNI